MRAATGTQYTLTLGESSATITELAAGLRALVLDGVEVIQSYRDNTLPPMADGIVLVPWPNRVAGGVWNLDGTEMQLDVTEPSTGNAIHGLLRNAPYRLLEESPSHVVLGAGVFPQHGYPFLLDTAVRYELSAGGLTVTHTITNRSEAAAPVAIGAHPYLKIGGVPTEELVLTLASSTVFDTDERQIPTVELSVDGTDFDLRGGRTLSDVRVDHGFGGAQVADGKITHSLTAPDGQRVELWGEPRFGYVQVYTPDNFPTETGPALAVAIEPMTAPADALNSGTGLAWLDRDETLTASWGISYFAG